MKAPRSLVLFAALIALNACATGSGGGEGGKSSADEGGRKEIVGLEEMSIEYIETLWGKPDSVTPTATGKTVRFKNIRAEDEDPINDKVVVKYCDVRLDVNAKQLVQSWQYETCRPK